jgi:hypothetical protein
VRMTVVLPPETPAGVHRIELRGASTGITASAAVTVTNAAAPAGTPAGTAGPDGTRGGALASTGISGAATVTAIALALGALLLGAAAVFWRRDRHQRG